LHCLKLPWSQAFMVSALIAQLGEFAFLLTTVALEAEVINPFGEKLIISLTVLSLAISPLWLLFARYLKSVADTTNTLSIRLYVKGFMVSMLRLIQKDTAKKESSAGPTCIPLREDSTTRMMDKAVKQRKKSAAIRAELNEDAS